MPIGKLDLLRDFGAQTIIIPHEVTEEYGDMRDWRHQVGTGPFMLTDYVAGSTMTFQRSPNCWQNDPLHPDNRLPYLDEVRFLTIADVSTTLAALLLRPRFPLELVGWLILAVHQVV